MTTKNIVFIAKSIDGFIADKDGGLDWLQMIPNPTNNAMGFVEIMNEIDAVVMGKTTFQTVNGFDGPWPYSKHVFVLSRSIAELPKDLEGQATLLQGTPTEILSQIHEKGYHKLYIDGGRTVQDFLRADLVDELITTTIPIILGEGTPLFTEQTNALRFNHEKTQVFLDQIVQSRYVRDRD